ncbi:MAG: hypothetical protein IJZ31_10180 [Bacteroidaceae bacterium]|nr:hypothetical protein [Bacteroidaceae bacterium]
MYYKEEELYNGTERVYLEEYKYNWIGECCRVGLCVNSLIIFCRADNNCTDGHEFLSQTNRASSWLNNLDALCPKVAWGITAWLLVYTNTDSKKRLIYGNDTKRGVFAKYKEECVKRYEFANKEDYDYYKANEDEASIKSLDEAFFAEHIKTEREYIRTFSRPECITEEYYQAILQCANEYIKWVEDNKEEASANVVYTNVSHDITENLNRRKGRRKKSLSDNMINDESGEKLQKLHHAIKGKIGKSAALIILAAIRKGWMEKPTYTQVKDEFGDVGTQQGFTPYLSLQRFSNEEIDGAINSLD